MLFADLVGFTTAFSEGRDAEDMRELLSRYFDTARTVIERYGGTVEKFIGDAVMAVWGAPVAHEDDAERAVRAGSSSSSRSRRSTPALQLQRGRVLTGEAAVTLGADGQGMVAGRSRQHRLADPERRPSREPCSSGESTRRSSEAAIVYADAGMHELKGKAEPVRALPRPARGRGTAWRGPVGRARVAVRRARA